MIEVDRRFAQLTSVIRLVTAFRAASLVGYSSTVPITLLRYMRFPLGPFSDHRNCQTSGPSRRDLVERLPCCIIILHARSGGAGKMFSDFRHSWHFWITVTNKWRKFQSRRAETELPCGGTAVIQAEESESLMGWGKTRGRFSAVTAFIDSESQFRDRGPGT